MIYAQNHDQTGNRQHGERLGHLVGFEAQKLAAAALILAPNLPLLFMGEEYGEPAPFQFFISHGDPELVEAVRRGRANEFAAFGWHGTIPDPQAEETFQRCKLHWELRDTEPHRTLLDWYRALLRLRTTHPALACPRWDHLEATADEAAKILTLRRWCGSAVVLIVLHLGNETRPYRLPPGRWQLLLASTTPPVLHDGTFLLAAWQVLVLSDEIAAREENPSAVS